MTNSYGIQCFSVFGLVVYTETPEGECESEAEEVITLHTLLEGTRPSESQPQPLLPPDQLNQVTEYQSKCYPVSYRI